MAGTTGNHSAVLLLGSNMGNRMGFLEAGIAGISTACGLVTKQSAVYESEVWGESNQPHYLNVAVVIETTLSAEALLWCCQQIEVAQGRERTGRWASRTLDIDILFYEDAILKLPHLKVPHPLISKRRFALTPLAEVIPEYVHPKRMLSIQKLLSVCKDKGKVWVWKEQEAVE